MEEIDCEYTDNLVCPYCGWEHDDTYDMNEAGEHSCEKCDKNFSYDVYYSKSYTSIQVPCLNGEPHNFKKDYYPNYPDYQRCRACGKSEIGKRVPEKVVL